MTADILKLPLTKAAIPSRWRVYHRRLCQLRDDLLRQQTGLANDALQETPSFSTHMADAGTDAYNRDFALGMLSSEQEVLYEVLAAIARIEHGTFGRCEISGKPIEARRLAAVPWTRFSASAGRKLEQEGAVKGARLGLRASVMPAPAPANSEIPGT